jgi:hypothetical protein
MFCLKKYYLTFIFFKHTLTMRCKLRTTALQCINSYKPSPRRDSDPRSSGLEVDAMTTRLPTPPGHKSKFYGSIVVQTFVYTYVDYLREIFKVKT